VAIALSWSQGWAQSFDDALEAALVHWRAASWYARTGNAGVAGLEIEAFRVKWDGLKRQFSTPPEPFARDQAWPETVTRITAYADLASSALEADDSVEVGRALRTIGDTLADLRARNGIIGFPDHLARYRDAVDQLSELSLEERLDEARIGSLRALTEQAAKAVAVLEQNEPRRWRGDPEFEAMLRQNREGVAALASALSRAGPPSTLEIVGLIRVVRSNYNLLFLRFGAAVPSTSVA
jgi:hypothetical protein